MWSRRAVRRAASRSRTAAPTPGPPPAGIRPRRRRAPRRPASHTSRTGRRASGAIRPSGCRWRRSRSWTLRLPPDGETHRVRPAAAADLRLHRGDRGLGVGSVPRAVRRGPEPRPGWRRRRSGAERDARSPGFLLVAGRPPIGFVHVLLLDGHAHLEQLSVRPEHQRRGIGTTLVRAAMARARQDGHDRLSLCTYRDVPWNGPFYRSLGFTEVSELAALPAGPACDRACARPGP